jgi:hypothetical protein
MPTTKSPTHNWSQGYTMREAIEAGCYYSVKVPDWACGSHDIAANSPQEAALLVGSYHEAAAPLGLSRFVATTAKVLRHLPSSRIGATYLEDCGVFPTMTASHFCI